jgi:hypothetical protein
MKVCRKPSQLQARDIRFNILNLAGAGSNDWMLLGIRSIRPTKDKPVGLSGTWYCGRACLPTDTALLARYFTSCSTYWKQLINWTVCILLPVEIESPENSMTIWNRISIYSDILDFNTLRTGDADLLFYHGETRYICKFSLVPLHKGECFQRYHTLKHY